MSGIFISYRREDSAGWTGRLAERLKAKFGAESLFMDIDTIQPGTDFAEVLRAAVGSCDVLLAMIGPKWTLATNPEGQPRLEDPRDWVRMELTAALSRNIPVIPVLVGGTALPNVGTLPEDLKKLFQYQSHELTDKRWDYDSSQLLQVLEKVLGGAKPPKRATPSTLARWSTWAAVLVLGLLLALGSLQTLKQDNNNAKDTESQRNGSKVSGDVATSSPASNAVETSAPAAGDTVSEAQQVTANQPESASTVAKPSENTERGRADKSMPAAGSAGEKGRSLPAGVEVKFNAGDLVYRLALVRLEENSNDSWFLVASFVIANTGNASVSVHYFTDFRLLVDSVRRSPTKSSGLTYVESDSENTGEATFIVPKSVRTVRLRITRGEAETTIPIDLKTGVYQSVVQPAGIPQALSRPTPVQVSGGGTFDFRKLMLEPYNVESFLLRISIRITAIDAGFHFHGGYFRLVVNDLSYEPIKGSLKGLSPHTYADEEVLFLVPKSADRALLRYPDHKWETSIDLKGGKT
ncbi:hypothetical protein YTPLAS18_05360 [Nitrospira sp.]|nr:hypothetical protein YTPLAS18_05360 [Nitrospira sp.]